MAQDARSRIAQWRLRNQQIIKQDFDEPGALVHWFGAVQAQDYGEALWAVGLRTKGAVQETIERAIARRLIVRTWPLRGTLHFVAPNDVRWMLQHFAPKVVAAAAARYRAYELNAAVFARAERVCVAMLHGGRVETRSDLYAAMQKAGIRTDASRGMHIMWHLAHVGLLCYGPRAAKQPTFALLDEWVPNARSLDRPAAIVEVARRYFASHGPAQLKDFAWWAGVTLTDARAGLEGAQSTLQSETIAGATYWFAEPHHMRRSLRVRAHLLPVLDEYTVAYRDRSAVIEPRRVLAVNAGGGLIKPIIVIDGQVRGTWKRTIQRGGVALQFRTFGRFSREQKAALDSAAARFARFIGVERVRP